MMDKSNPMDWVFALAIIQVFGLSWLMTATDGFTRYLSATSARRRKIALAASLLTIWMPFIGIWIGYGHSPLDMWRASTDWWQSDVDPGGMFIAIAGWWALLSPLQAVYAMFATRRAARRESREIQEAAAHRKMMTDTGLW